MMNFVRSLGSIQRRLISANLDALDRIFTKDMIRTANAGRIISYDKSPVQELNESLASYLFTGSVDTQVVSYLSLERIDLLRSYVAHGLIGAESLVLIVSTTLLLVGTAYQSGFDEWDDDEDEDSDGNDDPDEQQDEDKTDRDDDQNKGVIYARVSTDEQDSIPTQIENMKKIADEHGIIIHEEVTDEGQTGTNFNREGIRKVFKLAQRDDITHLLVDDVSRIGRNAPQTIYFIYILKKRCDVKIITNHGELDPGKVNDLMDSALRALVSHMSAQERGRKALDTKIHRFKHNRTWHSWFREVPLGYRENGDGWIEPDPEEREIIPEMFDHFLKEGSYAATRDYINERYSEVLDTNLTWQKVKDLLQRPVYIGKPTMDITEKDLDESEWIVHDENLALVNEETYDQVQERIKEKREKGSSSDDTKDTDYFTEVFGILPVLEGSDVVQLRCPACLGEMNKNGQRTLEGETIHNYICEDCGKQRKFPLQDELEEMLETFVDELKRWGYLSDMMNEWMDDESR